MYSTVRSTEEIAPTSAETVEWGHTQRTYGPTLLTSGDAEDAVQQQPGARTQATTPGIVYMPAHRHGGFAIWPKTHPIWETLRPRWKGPIKPIVLQSGPNSPPWDQ